MMATLSHLTAPLFTPADYHPAQDFISVSQVCASVPLIVVPTALGVNSIEELIELDASDPGALNYIKPGNGSFGHLMIETLNLNAGTTIQPIDYQGLPPGIIDLQANRVQVGALSVSHIVQHVAEGTLTPIAAVGNVRAAEFPDVPTLPEQGHAASNIDTVFFVIAPAGTPDDAVQRLHDEITASLARMP
ncbi:MAG: Bug family tripartite tricarboxylate transporter substrate binding protein [Paracoccaceae bacterium]